MVPLFALALFAQAPSYGLPPDTALDRPLALEARIEPLPELLARVGKELGAPLTVERRMEGLKATVFTPARPARLTLAGLASVFDAEWTPVKGGGYRLEETIPARNRRESHLRALDANRREAVDAFLREGGVPIEGRPGGNSGAGFGRMAAEARGRYRAATPNDRDRFLDGETLSLIGSDPGAPGEEPKEVGQGVFSWVPARPPGPTLLLLRARPDLGGVQTLTIGGEFSGSSHRWPEIDHPRRDLSRTGFARAQAQWALEWWKSDAPELRRPLAAFAPVRPPWAKGEWTDSDALEALHRASGIAVVAEAFRTAESPRAIPASGTLGDALRRAGLAGGLRFEAGTLLHRPEGFATLRAVEPPESVMARFEREPEPTLEGRAEMFAEFPAAGLDSLWRVAARRPIPGVGPGDNGPGVWALRLWGSLTPEERAAALRPEGIALDRIGRPGAAREAIEESLFGFGCVILRPDERAGSEAGTVIALLGLGPGGPFTLRAERGASEPPGYPNRRRSNSRDAPTGLVLRIADAEGRGLLLFAPG